MALQVTVALQGSPLCLCSTLYPRSDPCSRRGTAVSRVSPRETHLILPPLSCRLVSENRAGATARTTATTVTKRYRPSRAPFWSCAHRAAHASLCCGGLPCSAEPTCQHACMHRAAASSPFATHSVHSLISAWACTLADCCPCAGATSSTCEPEKRERKVRAVHVPGVLLASCIRAGPMRSHTCGLGLLRRHHFSA